VELARQIKIEKRKRKMINRRQSWSDFSRNDRKKSNKRKRWKNADKQRNCRDKRRKKREINIWKQISLLMSLMNSRESIAIRLITTDNLNQLVTTRHLSRIKIILEQPKCLILHQILPSELVPHVKTLTNRCLMQLVIGTELDLEDKLKIPIINKLDRDLLVHHQIRVDR
jgi:hypothetical protein